MPILLIFILINIIGWVDDKSLKITKQKNQINILFIIKNMKFYIAMLIAAVSAVDMKSLSQIETKTMSHLSSEQRTEVKAQIDEEMVNENLYFNVELDGNGRKIRFL